MGSVPHGLWDSSAFFPVSLSISLHTFPWTYTELRLCHGQAPRAFSSFPFPLPPGAQDLLGYSLKAYLRSLHLAEVRDRSGVDSESRVLCWLELPRRPFGEALLTHTLQEAGVSFLHPYSPGCKLGKKLSGLHSHSPGID